MTVDRDVLGFALRFFRALDTPRSLACYILAKNEEWDQLVNLSCVPTHYRFDAYHTDLLKFRRDNASTALLRKCDGLPTSVDKKAAAIDAFVSSERSCYKQNDFLSAWFSLKGDGVTTSSDAPQGIKLLARALSKARRFISRALGELPNYLNGRFGPGATFESVSFDAKVVNIGLTAYDKLHHTPTATTNVPEALIDHVLWQTAFGTAAGAVLSNRLVPRVPGNRFTSVPKDSTKNRGICIEPGVNIIGQLAIGTEIRNRLKRLGLDLKNGQDLHRRMAREASRTGNQATIDLSNASDTISSKLVEILLPPEWFQLLSSFRSTATVVRRDSLEGYIPRRKNKKKDVVVRLHKYSSMGNGYTFELETLIFSSLIHAMGGRVGRDSFVYGDDIIIPTKLFGYVSKLLTLTGFTLNPKKSFATGVFRESCGGDFVSGEDVRPHFIKELPYEPLDWMVLHNRVRDLANRLDIPELLPVALSASDRIPRNLRVFGPADLGDICLHGPIDKWTMRRAKCRNTGTDLSIREVRVVVPIPLRKKLERYGPSVALAAAALGLPSLGLSPRDSVAGHKVRWLAYS